MKGLQQNSWLHAGMLTQGNTRGREVRTQLSTTTLLCLIHWFMLISLFGEDKGERHSFPKQ